MKVHMFLTPYMRSFTYVVEENNHVIVVDPCEMDEVERVLQEKKLDYAFLTHEHYDHISGTDWIRTMGAQVVASQTCDKNLGNVKLNHSKYYSAFCAAQSRLAGDPIPDVKAFTTHADWSFQNEMVLSWQGHSLLFRETPGHSTGSACLLIDQKILFSGDVIFRDETSNPDIMCGNQEQLEQSVAWVLSLSPEVQIYPGHYEAFILSERGIK